MLATGANDGVAALSLWQAKDGATPGAFFIDMSFTVAEAVTAQSEKSAEFFVFTTARLDISRERTRKDRDHQSNRQHEIEKRHEDAIHEQRNNGMHDHKPNVNKKQCFIEGVRAVSAVEKAIKGIFQFSHFGKFLPAAHARQAAFLFGCFIRSEAPQRGPSWKPDARGSILR